MKFFEIKLTNALANLTVYLPDSSKEMPQSAVKPGVLVIPGGGYSFCSDREAEPVALAFAGKGYAAFVLRYTIGTEYDFSMPFADVNEAMKIIHDNAQEWNVDKNRAPSDDFRMVLFIVDVSIFCKAR